MPHIWLKAAEGAGRVVAGIAGLLCFYMAFFLYEDEEGRWQNRLEKIWININDRARSTHNASIAFFNAGANALKALLDHIFGSRLISFDAVVGSIAVSTLMVRSIGIYWDVLDDFENPGRSYFGECVWIVIVMGQLWGIVRRRPWVALLWTLPSLYYFVKADENQVLIDGGYSHSIQIAINLFAVLLSLICDVAVIAVIRKQMRAISQSMSAGQVLLSMFVFVASAGVVYVLPNLATLAYVIPIAGHEWFMQNEFLFLAALNLPTAIYALCPFALLGILLLHRASWPVADRFIYSLCRRRLLSNSKVLVGIGVLCFTIALNLEKVGIQELLKLFS